MKSQRKIRPWCHLLIALGLWAGVTHRAIGAERPVEAQANVMVEIPFTASRPHVDPFNTVTVDVRFTGPAGQELRVPAFWAGGDVWKVRYSSPVPGTHTFRSECSDAQDAGLHGVIGSVEVKPYTGDNLLLRHGALRVADDQRHFAHADGTPFFWLGDTWWMGLTKRLAWPEDVRTLAADRRAKGFNVIQIVAGLYPDMPAFDERGANEAGFPWEPDYARIRPEYFDAADRRILFLAEQGFVPCVVGAWGYHLPWLGVDKMQQHWRHLIARWGALPVVWCAAGETTMPFYLSTDRAAESARQQREWTAVMRYIRDTDPFHRLVTCHPAETARASVTDPTVLDFDMHQSGHGSPAPQHGAQALAGWRAQPVMPVISGESRYEALEIRPTVTATDARQAFWAHVINSGCAGHTYGANGIWQVNGRTQPYGNSPAGNNWGTTPWDEAMHLPGSTQLAAARRLIESLPQWHQLEPRPEWVTSGSAPEAAPSLASAQWIWFPEGEPAQDAPAERRYFRRAFAIPDGKQAASARLLASADDHCVVWLNGERLGERAGWMRPLGFRGLAGHLRAGTNVLAIEAENLNASAHPNPAGLVARFEIVFEDESRSEVVSDAEWRSAKHAPEGWTTRTFDASSWSAAKALGAPGVAPWGDLDLRPESAAPLCAAVGDRLRLVYLFEPGAVKLSALAPGAGYAATWVDPVSGERRPEFVLTADANGEVRATPPTGEHDWALTVLRRP